MSKPPRPTLQPPDLTPGRNLPNDNRFDQAASLETPEAVGRRVATGSVRVLNQDTSVAEASRSPELSLSTKVPIYLMKQLRLRSAEQGVTIRNLLLLALQAQGFTVHEEDITDERKRR